MDQKYALCRYGVVQTADVSAPVRRLPSTSDIRQKKLVALFLKVRMLYVAQRAPLSLALARCVSTLCSSARASRPLTRKVSYHLKVLTCGARPLPVCARTARGARRATEKPGLRPQVRLRGDMEFKRGGLERSEGHLGNWRRDPRPGPSRLHLTPSLRKREPRKLGTGRVTPRLVFALC